MMSVVGPESHSSGSAEAREIDLRQLVHALWRYRIAILLLALCCAILGAAASILLTKQESRGLFLAPDVTLDAYKRYESAMANILRLEEFLDASGEGASPAGEILRSAVESRTLGKMVRPIFAFTDKDAKAYGVKVEDKENKLVGIELSVSRKEAEGPVPVLVLAEFVRDVIIKTDLQEFTLSQCLANQTRDKELRNAQLVSEFDVAQERLRAESIRGIMLSTPGADNITGLQAVSLEDGTERFLSPAAQLVAAEIKISDLGIEQKARDRDRVTAALRQSYYCSANAALAERSTGQDFLARLDAIHAQTFAGSDMTESAVEETSNGLLILAQRWRNTYLQHMRFVTSPQGAEVRLRKFSPIVGALAGGIFGLMTGVLLGLLLSWWRENRDAVIANP